VRLLAGFVLCFLAACLPGGGTDDEGVGSDPLNATYEIEGQEIWLRQGRSEIAVGPASATKIKTSVFGNPIAGDLDGDGDQDAVLILAHDSGGSGTFYYVAAAVNLGGRYRGTNAVLLGDRISPQDLAIENGIIVAAYRDRHPAEPMIAEPSVDMRVYLTLEDGGLTAVKSLEARERNR
jgi:hypothetical protein